MPSFRRLLYTTVGTTAAAGAGWYVYTRKTYFVPFSVPPESAAPRKTTSITNLLSSSKTNPEFPNSAWALLNPLANSPNIIDNAERRVPLSQLKTQDRAELTREFCRGIWGGWGFEIQRRYLERKWRALPGREKMLWERDELLSSNYDVGTQIADHFEVLERDDGRVTIRCGDSPLVTPQRPSDGIFSIEVDIDEEKNEAVFHLKSLFVNTTPEGNKPSALPWWLDPGHKEYTKLWMETSVRRLLE